MDKHRLVSSEKIEIIPVNAPFSSFQFVEENFPGSLATHRCFSLARSAEFQTLVVEDIPAMGLILDENQEIRMYVTDHLMTGLKRLSFWKPNIKDSNELKSKSNSDLIGYAILKKDYSLLRSYDNWHVFESVFQKYPHRHNCLPKAPCYQIGVGGNEFEISGVLYCQQNTLNKVCAHVALRSIISSRLPDGDVPYSKLNEVAISVSATPFNPADGLGPKQIRAILKNFGIPFKDIDYSESEKNNPDIRRELPYQKYLYAGVESGSGALLGFKLTGPNAINSRHIIPFYGHTFNKDTWAPDAEASYFNIGGGVGYIPSESWTSSFIGHDDNFGSNFCVPRSYVKPEQVEYVVELLYEGAKFGGLQAEAIALTFIYSLYSSIAGENNPWIQRLVKEAHPDVQRVVLRAISVEKDEYLKHLSEINDWDGNAEDHNVPEKLNGLLPERVWVVEISIPQLFPANERKLGEVLLNPSVSFDSTEPINFDLFLLARIPGFYFLIGEIKNGNPSFMHIPSRIQSHTELLII